MAKRLALVLLVGCASYASRGRSVAPNDLGTDRARVTNFLTMTMNNNTLPETAAHGIPREAVADEATLASLDSSHACVELTMRTPVRLDQPLSTWTFKLNDEEVSPENETVTVRDYFYTGSRPVVVAEAVSLTAYASLTISEPTEEIYRVMERTARLCGASAKSVSLVAELDPRDGMSKWGEQFRWEVR
jgi:hypothetical protein